MRRLKNRLMAELHNAFISVIIPVFNDSERLKTCLEALENQTYPKSLYEVIVVDNRSDENIEGVVHQFGQAFATCETCPGSYAARNKGISLAKGDVIAFTDSDCIPASDWIEKGVANLLYTPNCGLVAGKIELFFKNPDQPTSVELYESIRAFRQQKFVEESRYGATANLFTFRNVIDKVGSFDKTLKSSGDREWGERVFAAGYEQIYADDTCVAHPARHSWSDLYKKVVRLLGGHQDLKKQRGYSFKDFIKDLAKDLSPPLRMYFRIWSEQRLKGNKQKLQYILVILYVKYCRAWERIRLHLGGRSTRA